MATTVLTITFRQKKACHQFKFKKMFLQTSKSVCFLCQFSTFGFGIIEKESSRAKHTSRTSLDSYSLFSGSIGITSCTIKTIDVVWVREVRKRPAAELEVTEVKILSFSLTTRVVNHRGGKTISDVLEIKAARPD